MYLTKAIRYLLISAVFLVALPLCSQQQKTQQSPADVPSFSQEMSVSIVNLYASVRDKKGRPVYGLKQDDFSLSIDGKPQQITNFSADITEPVNIAFLLDVSGSMRYSNKFDIAKGVVRSVIQRMGKDDQAALIIFADNEAQMLVDFTTDKEAVLKRMDKLKAYGGTALRDAIAYCHRLLIESIGKKGVLLLSDGVDTRSNLTLDQAVEQAAKVELPIYTFELVRNKWLKEGKAVDEDDLPLKAFAEDTGGLYFTVDQTSSEEIDKACVKIFEDLKYQYYIGYMPQGNSESYGKIDLKVGDGDYRIRVRYSAIHGG
jgi:Ca-activated chloride channel homolog